MANPLCFIYAHFLKQYLNQVGVQGRLVLNEGPIPLRGGGIPEKNLKIQGKG